MPAMKMKCFHIALCFLLVAQVLCAQDDPMQQLQEQRELLAQYAGDSVNTATIYNNIGVMHHMLQQYDSAEVYHLKALAIRKQLYDPQHPEYQQTIGNLLALYTASQKYEQVIRFCEQTGDTLNISYASALHFIAAQEEQAAHYAQAAEKMRRVVILREQLQGNTHPDYTSALNMLALCEQQQEHYAEAERLYQEALAIQRETIGKRHPDYISTLSNLSALFYLQGNYAAAEPLMRETLNFRKREFGPWSAEYASSLNQMAVLYHALGNYIESAKIAEQSLAIIEHELGKDSQNYARGIANLGEIYRAMGEYAKAEPLLKEACERQKATLGNGHPEYAISLNNLATLYQTMGDNEAAKPLLNEVLWIKKQTVGKNHTDYAIALRNMGNLYMASGNYEAAEPLLTEGAEITLALYGAAHPDYALSLANLAVLYERTGRYDEAEPLLQEVLDIRKNALGENHPDYAMTLNNIAILYCKRQDFAEAEKWQRKALAIYQRHHNTLLKGYSNVLYNLGTICLMLDKMDEAESLYRRVFEMNKEQAQKMFCFMSERQRNLYWAQNNGPSESAYPTLVYKYRTQKPEISVFAYDNELYLKGLLLNATMQVQNTIANSGDTALMLHFRQLKAVKEQIIHLQQQSNPSLSRLDSLQQVAERLDKQLVKSSQAYRQSQQAMHVDWQQVRSSLRDHEVAIEFSSFWINVNGAMQKQLVALILRNTSGHPFYIDLGKEDDIAAYLAENPGDTYDEERGGALYERIWKPILPYLLPKDTIYFAPAGVLHQLNLAALPVNEETVMGEVHTLRRISSTRELALQQAQSPSPSASAQSRPLFQAATLIGGVDYGEGKMPYLAGTLSEVENLQEQLTQALIPAHLLTGTQASEEAFKELRASDCELLHIATHGFFYPNEKISQQEYFARQWQLVGDGAESAPAMDPLMRSGLMLANANIAWSHPTNPSSLSSAASFQDGVLTAKEVALVDLSGTKLVVLSACETGRGEVTSEGLFGLQRAFKQAGAKTIIMSLWKVNDRATALMMTTFYEHLMAGESPRQSFQLAQQTVREEYPDPYFWAAFVMID